MLELDHQHLYCRGGGQSVENLQLKCRYHNYFASAQALGQQWFEHKLSRVWPSNTV